MKKLSLMFKEFKKAMKNGMVSKQKTQKCGLISSLEFSRDGPKNVKGFSTKLNYQLEEISPDVEMTAKKRYPS